MMSGSLPRIFITGASGCLGHYVLNRLAFASPNDCGAQASLVPPYHLVLLVRDAHRLAWSAADLDRAQARGTQVTVLEGDLRRIQDHAQVLAETDALIHLAAAWGDAETAHAINVTHTLELFQLLNPDRCQKILYFSTASLLDTQNQPMPIAGEAGTDYIRSKYDMLLQRDQIHLHQQLVTLYPTLLFGGNAIYPYSHITAGLKDVLRWLGLVRFLRVDFSFHFIHAQDVAEIVAYLLTQPTAATDLVLGNPPLTFDQCVEQLCAFYNKRIYARLPIPLWLVRTLAFLWRVQLSSWDDYCLRHRHFVYQTVTPRTFGLPSHFPTLEKILATYG
jgi:nucleoside-diphosphate-sugar epimerase